MKCFNLSGRPIVPPFTHFVTDVTVTSDASTHFFKQFLLKNQAADKSGYFVETKSGRVAVRAKVIIYDNAEADVAKAVAEEREACAKMVEELVICDEDSGCNDCRELRTTAAAIRARGSR